MHIKLCIIKYEIWDTSLTTNGFVDREVELNILEDEWRQPGFRLIIVYGRRRIGKTRLLTHWIRRHGGVYYTAAQLNYQLLSREFSETVGRVLGVYVTPDDIVKAIEELAAREERIAIVLDEFQYIAEADHSVMSRLQRLIDTSLKDTRLLLVLSGSSVSFFEKELLGYKAPLHGRRTRQIHLKPMRILEAMQFWPKMNPIDATRSYSIIGGTPAYLSLTRNAETPRDVLSTVFKPGSPLLEEAENFLRQEVREPKTYASILKAVATGRTRISEISGVTGVDPRIISKYVNVLESLDIMETVYPLGRRKGGRVRITDPYFLYYYKHITTLRNLVETGYTHKAVSEAERTLDTHTSTLFEQIIQSITPDLHAHGIIKAKPVQVAPWWYKQHEIDLVARNPGETTSFIEAKWSDITLREAERIIASLEEKASKTGLQSPVNQYIVIARTIKDASTPTTSLDRSRTIVDYSRILRVLERRIRAKRSKASGKH
jgi:AAA+ ATPase superfamily predicted ATPase